ncbi:phage portal protein [Pseudoroseomonas cervicalis]|uniref:phage portal protein n=1 Tax=Teichococcus cervicalis TaxID=204525 RepID=UPI0027889049|nr:phage portal protein [Pseudoroseomonas cervicalis]MDQ1081436.1 HK97 family phage portal protein [Pseudoroseomonas cervicalis]
MGFWSRLIGREERAASFSDTLDLLRGILAGGRSTKSGSTVNVTTALQVTTVLAGARVLAEDVSGLPLKVVRQTDDRRTYLSEDPLQQLLDFPNEWQTGREFREQMMLHAVLCGNGIAWKNIVRGEVRELLPLHPGWCTTEQNQDWGIVHKVRLPDGTSLTLRPADVLHLRGPSWSGFSGLEVLNLAREAIGLAIATENAHAKLHQNGLQTTGTYSVDGALNETQFKQLRAYIEAHYAGPQNAGRPLLLDRSAKFAASSMSGVDAQHLETRKFQIEEIARALRVFPQMIGYSDKASTFASAEAFFLAHVKYSLMPWIDRWEGVIKRDLIGRDRVGVRVKHNVAALERADIKTRYAAYGQGIKDGWLLRNEARGWEDLDEIPGLSEPLQPLNMATPGSEGDQQDDALDAGGQPTKGRRPFGARAFIPNQPRGADGRWVSSGSNPRQIKRFHNRAKRSRRAGKVSVHMVGLVSSANAANVLAATGLTVVGLRRTMGSDNVLHALRQHGDRVKESRRGQVAITAADLGRVPRIVAAATRIERGKNAASGPSYVYTARLGRFEYTYVEQLRRGQGTVTFKTLWKRRI